MGAAQQMTDGQSQDDRYALAAKAFGPAVDRLVRAYEADPDKRLDLLQDIHLALWRSMGRFDGRCALRTWVYRVAHNVGASHILKQRSLATRLTTLEAIDFPAECGGPEEAAGQRQALERMMTLIRALRPADRQVMLLYLEDLDAAEIAEVTGLTPGAVATRVHRAKTILARNFQTGGRGD
jgi:RNA polymerase sigma-70 factor (ECF subfamily)